MERGWLPVRTTRSGTGLEPTGLSGMACVTVPVKSMRSIALSWIYDISSSTSYTSSSLP
jgi:hypothetical protein